MSLNKDLADALAGTVAKQHPAYRVSSNWIPYHGPRGGEGYINAHTGDVVYSDERPGMAWGGGNDDIEIDESFRAAPDGYQWARAPMNYEVSDEIEEKNPENVDGFLEAKFSGDQVIYEQGEGDEAAHSWGRVTGARVDTYTNLGGHEVRGVVLELESGDDVPLDGVAKHVDTSQDPKYEAWQLADENPHEADLEAVSEKVYHSFSHDEFEWKGYADWRNDAKALPVLSERGSDQIWQAMSVYFDSETMNDLRKDMASWKSDSDRGSGRYSDIAKKVFEIDADSREGWNDGEWDTSNQEDFERAVEILADVSRRFYEDQYEDDALYRGISRHGFRSLVKGWLENPGAEEFEVEHRALANYTADHRVARDWSRNTAVIAPSIDPEDIILAIDGLNFSGVHNTESEVHMRGDRVTVKPSDVKLATRKDDSRRNSWPDRKAGLSEPESEWNQHDVENFSRAISLIYAEETPGEEAARRFLNIAKQHEEHVEQRVNSERFDFDREKFFTTGTGGPGQAGEVVKWETEYQDLLTRIETEHGLTLESVEKAENPPGSPDETPVIDLTQDWFLHPKYRDDPETAEKQVTNVTGEWVPYEGPRGGEGWQRTSDHEVVYQDDPPGDVAEGYDRDFWERFGSEEDETKDPSGYYDAEAWDAAFPDMAIDSPADVPEGAELEFENHDGRRYTATVTGFEYGRDNSEGFDGAYLVVSNEDGHELAVPPNFIEGIEDIPNDEQNAVEYDWDTDVPRIDELDEGADVLYEGEGGVRRVGQYERPTFVQTEEGTFGGAILEDGTEIRLQDMVAVDEGAVPLEPRDDPFEFDSVLTEEGLRQQPPSVQNHVDELWEDRLEHTPFDDLGEVPLGAEVEFDSRKVNDPVVGEVTGYIDYDAEIGETNSLRVETDDDYVGEATVSPSNFRRFIGPEGERERSLEEYLSDPWEHTRKVENPHEAGVRGGNTTGMSMKILTMPDETRIFATPVEAYENITTGVVDSPAEARENNLNSPIMIQHLGGNGCATEIVEGPDGKEYIAKEGIPGDDLRSRQYSIDQDNDSELIDSLKQTTAAAFFVGNQDLHSGNIRVNFDTQEATIIDHDAAGPGSFSDFCSIHSITNDPLDVSDVEEGIYEIARGYMRGETDIPEELQGTSHESYFKDAIDQLANDQDHSDVFEPWDGDPHSLPDHANSMDDFEAGQEVTVLSSDGRIRTGELTDRYQGSWYGETADGHEISFGMPHHVLTSEPPESGQEETALTDDAGSQYDELTDLNTGMGITINQGLGDEEVVVEEIDNSGSITQMLVRPTDGDDPFHVNTMDDVVEVGHDSIRDIDSEGVVHDLSQLNTGEEIEAVDEDGKTYTGTFMGYDNLTVGEQIQVQHEPGRVITIESPQNVKLQGDSE